MSESLVNLLLLLLSDQRFLYIRIFDCLHTINSRLPKIRVCVLDGHQDESWLGFSECLEHNNSRIFLREFTDITEKYGYC